MNAIEAYESVIQSLDEGPPRRHTAVTLRVDEPSDVSIAWSGYPSSIERLVMTRCHEWRQYTFAIYLRIAHGHRMGRTLRLR